MRLPVSDLLNETIELRFREREREIRARVRAEEQERRSDLSRRGLISGRDLTAKRDLLLTRELQLGKIACVAEVLEDSGVPFGGDVADALGEDIGASIEGLEKRISEIDTPSAKWPDEVQALRVQLSDKVRLTYNEARLAQNAREVAGYATLREVELALRKFIRDTLSIVDVSWQKTRVPGAVRQKWEKHLGDVQSKAYSWLREMPAPPLFEMADFNDYVDIIQREDNWKQAFEPLLLKKQEAAPKLHELQALRNQIAHMRPLTPKACEALNQLAADVLARLSQAVARRA